MRIRGDFRLFILCFALVTCSRLLAQQSKETHPQDSTYTFKSNVDVVLVHVVVRVALVLPAPSPGSPKVRIHDHAGSGQAGGF